MSLFWWKKQHSVINKIKTYFNKIDDTRDCFLTTAKALILEGPKPEMAEEVEKVHRCEHSCDEIQRDIVLQLYKKALIPESRGDVLGLLEATDKVPNTFESLCWQLFLQKIIIPPEFKERFISLIQANVEAYNLLREAILGLFFNQNVQQNLDLIYEKESASDGMERCLIKDIYDTELELAEKNLLKDTVINIGNISDLVEATNDRLILAIIKRKT